MDVNILGSAQNASLAKTKSTTSNPGNFVQFKGRSLSEMSALTSKDDKFTPSGEKTLTNVQRFDDSLIRTYSDGTKEIISDNINGLSKKHYTTIDKYDLSGDCITSIMEGDNGTYKSTLLDKRKRIFSAELSLKNNPQKVNAALTYKETRDDIEILEAAVKQPDGTSYSLKKETNEYGFETGKYILTKTDKRGKSESQKVWAFEIKPGEDKQKFKDSNWFKVKDVVFASDIGLKGLIY